MGIYTLGDLVPDIHPDAFVHPGATVIGAVALGAEASVWPAAVLRGDYGHITVGASTSVQDGTVIHSTAQWPTVIGEGCVLGHSAHAEGCTIGDGCLIGSGAIVLNRATVHSGGAVGAATLVPEDATVPTGHIAVGVPGRLRPAPADLHGWLTGAVDLYRGNAKRYRAGLRRIG